MSRKYQPGVIADRVVDDEATSDLVTQLEAEADRDIAANVGPAGVVTLRWAKPQIDVVKRAAAIIGIPYQTYLKQVVFKQAVADIEQAQRASATP